jgi:hypothetical protein
MATTLMTEGDDPRFAELTPFIEKSIQPSPQRSSLDRHQP